MTPRPAVASDVAAITALEALLFGADAWSEASVRGALGDTAVVGDRPDGYAVTAVLGDLADLHRIAVHPAARRSGVASLLLADAVDRAAAAGAERMLLEVSADNEGARGFYAVRGFTEIDRRPRYYRDGSDALVLQRVLVG